MNTLYCPSCGNSNQYTLNKPKFCGDCGKAFSFSKVTAKKRLTKTINVVDADEEEFETDLDLIDIDQLSFRVLSSASSSEKVEDLVKEGLNIGEAGVKRSGRRIADRSNAHDILNASDLPKLNDE